MLGECIEFEILIKIKLKFGLGHRKKVKYSNGNISIFQCRRCPHYFLPNLDLFKGKSPTALDNASKLCWRLTRELLTNSKALENL